MVVSEGDLMAFLRKALRDQCTMDVPVVRNLVAAELFELDSKEASLEAEVFELEDASCESYRSALHEGHGASE